jgi:hypothetical protein
MDRYGCARAALAPVVVGIVIPLVVCLRDRMPEAFRYSTTSVAMQILSALGISVPFILILHYTLETWSKRRQ